jgi:hypothetical protein
VIGEKELKLPTYLKSCGEAWLVIYNLQGALDIDQPVRSPTYRTEFDRVYLFDGFGTPVRLNTRNPDDGARSGPHSRYPHGDGDRGHCRRDRRYIRGSRRFNGVVRVAVRTHVHGQKRINARVKFELPWV